MDGLSGFGSINIGGGAQASNQLVELSAQPDLDSERFQQLWMQLPDAATVQKMLRADIAFNTGEIEQLLVQNQIFCMASGQIGNELKFFFYA